MTEFKWSDIPQQTQRQDSLTEQLNDLYRAAVRLGMYDAADFITGRAPGTAKQLEGQL